MAPCTSEIEKSTGLTGEKLTDGEAIGGSVITNVFPNSFHTYGCPWLVQRLTRASSTVAMADGGAARWWARHLR